MLFRTTYFIIVVGYNAMLSPKISIVRFYDTTYLYVIDKCYI